MDIDWYWLKPRQIRLPDHVHERVTCRWLAHVLNKGGLGVLSPIDRVTEPLSLVTEPLDFWRSD